MGAKALTMIALAVAVIGGGYVVYPCVMLYRLDEAVSHGNTAALHRLIDWPEVRQGLEADLAGSDGSELAPFGASFMRTVAVNAAMTPENVISALRAADPGRRDRVQPHLRGIWPEGPFAAVVDLGTVRLRVELQGGEWRVTRVWLPQTVLAEARAIARR